MGRMIKLTAGDGHTCWAPTRPDRTGCCTSGLVIVQEIFGVNGHMRNVCDQFAAEGFRCRRPCPVRPGRARRSSWGMARSRPQARHGELRSGVPAEAGMADVQAAACRPWASAGSASWDIAGAARSPGGARRAARASRPRSAGMAAASPRRGRKRPACGGTAPFRRRRPRHPAQRRGSRSAPRNPVWNSTSIPAPGHGFGCDERASFDKAASELAHGRTRGLPAPSPARIVDRPRMTEIARLI